MAAKLVAGAPPKRVRAYRQVRVPGTDLWRTATRSDRRSAGDRWRAQGSVRLWTGEIVKRSVSGKTAAAAEDGLIARLQAELDASNPEQPRSDLDISALTEEWLASAARHDVARSTLAVYEATARRWLLGSPLPQIARVRVRALEPRDVSAWLLTIAVQSGIPTARTARSVLSTVVRYGIAEGHATVNPVRDATTPSERVVEAERHKRRAPAPERRPGPSATLDHRRAFTPNEVARILAAATATPERAEDDVADLLAFLDGTGVRLGAALATLWTDLDLDGIDWASAMGLDGTYAWLRTGTHTITRVAGVGLTRAEYGTTKRSTRHLALPASLTERLRERRASFADSPWVFPNPLQRDQPREVSAVTKRLRRLFDDTLGDDGAPLTWASSHTFRRSLVTDAHDAGVPERFIAGQTGHGRIQVLQDHYIARVPVTTVGADLRDRAPRPALPVERGESNSESNSIVKGT